MAWPVLPGNGMESWLSELRGAARSLWRFRGLTAPALFCLAAGIGACVTLFASINPWLFRPLPYPNAGRLLALRESWLGRGGRSGSSAIAAPNYLDWQARARCFASLGAYRRIELNLSTEGEPERVPAARVTASLFPTLGVGPVLGRGFTPRDELASSVALIGSALWQRRFAGDPGVLGRRLDLDGTPHVVVGVMPPGFAFPEYAEVWTPLGLAPGAGRRDRHELEAIGRLAPDMGLARARTELDTLATLLSREHPDTNRDRGIVALPLLDSLTPPGVVLGLYLLLGAGLFVLLIACANVANLMLVKTASQRRETAVRLALGAGAGRILGRRLLEAGLLAVLGTALGLLLAGAGTSRLLGSTPVPPPFWVRFDFDWRVAAFTAGVAALSAVLGGLLPALLSGDASLAGDLKDAGRALAGPAMGRTGRALVVGELSLSLLLLIGAALMVQSFLRRNRADPGIDTRGVLTARLALGGDAYQEPASRRAFVEELERRLRARRGVLAAGVATALPFVDPVGGHWTQRTLEVEGRAVDPGDAPRAVYWASTAGYFAAAGIPLRRGSLFTPEQEAGESGVVIVSDALAERAWGRSDPLGRRLRLEGGPWLRVVGVVHEVVDPGDMLMLEGKPTGQIYVPYGAEASPGLSIAVRVARDPSAFAATLRDAVASLDPGLPVYSVFGMDEVRSRSAWVARLWGALLGQVAALAFLLATVGVYGVVSHAVSQRTHEIGVRMAVGADRARVLRLLLGDALRLALAGAALGLLGALAMSGALAGLLYGIQPLDPATLLGCAAVLIAATLAASYLPARSGTRVDPVVALRAE